MPKGQSMDWPFGVFSGTSTDEIKSAGMAKNG
jgi:hypothetical protein